MRLRSIARESARRTLASSKGGLWTLKRRKKVCRNGSILRSSGELLGDNQLRGVFIARLLPLARTFVSLPAGARHLRLVPFIALTAAGCAIWAAGFVLVGVAAGSAWQNVDSVAGKALLAAVLALLGITFARRGRRRG